MKTIRILVLILAAFLAITALPASAAPITLTGEVTYRERIALPPNSVLNVDLIDLADPSSRVVGAEAAIAAKGQVPLTFTLNFDDTVLKPGHAYGLSARIIAENRIVFRNGAPYALDPRAPAQPIIILVTPANEPVAIPVPETPAILDTIWHAIEIGSKPVIDFAETSLTIASDMRAGGKGACNSYFAQAELEGEALAFSAVAATRMLCADAVNAQEAAFFAALGATRFWRVEADLLYLLDTEGKEVLRFTRTPG